MFHNIKADIIYYKTTTDFELEFNLCGCCRMRLLSDKMQDKKSFVHSLARAVSRSNVILIVGALFGENSIIQNVAEAINTSTQAINNAEYGISGEQEIKILKDATPLVTAEGYLGGCIIESGPQTMILLTENKDVRKTIMKTLIHPYIEELYTAQIKHYEIPEDQDKNNDIIIGEHSYNEESIADDNQSEEDYPIEDGIITDSLPFEETANNNATKQPPQTTLEEDISEEAPLEESVDLFVEPTKLDRQTVERYTQEYTIQEDSFNYDDDDLYAVEAPKRKIKLSFIVLIISIVLLLVVAVLCYCIFVIPAKQGVSPVENLQEIFNTMFI